MEIGLLIVLVLVLFLPFTVKIVEQNVEFFLFIMGIIAAVIAGVINWDLIVRSLVDPIGITLAVIIAGLLFKWLRDPLERALHVTVEKMNFGVFVAATVILLGLISSLITAIIAALVLVFIVGALPLDRKNMIRLIIISCYSIGLGAALTPLGEPLSTIVVSKMDGHFTYLLELLGIYIIPTVVILGIFAGIIVKKTDTSEFGNGDESETYGQILFRGFKVFVFVTGLTLLGAGYEPLINRYLLDLHPGILYWINTISAVLDNATLAAAEISPKMTPFMLKAILMGLCISGGMLIPGNIPNIIAAGKLSITSKEWAKEGLPFGFILMLIFFVIMFAF